MTLLAEPVLHAEITAHKSQRHGSCKDVFSGGISHTYAQLHEVVVDCPTARLDYKDIFSSHRVLDLAAGLSDGKFAQDSVSGGHT